MSIIDIQQVVRGVLAEALGAVEYLASEHDVVEIELEHPADLAHGDYASNVAMRLAKRVGKNPRELAEDIVAKIPEHKYINKVEVAGPGFINITLSEAFYEAVLSGILAEPESVAQSNVLSGRHILLEHSSPNLFKPFHIGHLVNNSYGEALRRILGAAGAEVTTISFPSDISPGIAKAVWGIMDMGIAENFSIEQIGDAYARGSQQYKEDESVQARIHEINALLYTQTPGTEWDIYVRGKELSMEYFTMITGRLNARFDDFIYETEAEVVGKEIVRAHTPGIFEESDGAVIFRGSEYGLFDNVYINSAGFGTYLAKDTGLLQMKFERYDFDTSITVTDIEQKQHFELVKKSAELINPQWAERSLYLQHGRLALTTGRISSRDGGVPLATEILDSVKQRALERGAEHDMPDEVAEMVAVSAVKYAIVRASMGRNIVFDLEQSLSFEGDSGPYLQYTYARCQSVLSKAYPQRERNKVRVQMPRGWEVTDVERLLYRSPEVLARSAQEYAPHHIANYLNELASAYNSWYARAKILDGSDEEHYKLALTEATAHALKRGLALLGIDAPERM